MNVEQSAVTGLRQRASARGELWLLLGFIVVTLNLRIAFAGVGPILGELRLSATQATLIASLPPICLSLFALVGVRLRQRFGEERTLFAALLVLAVGCGVRALGVHGLFVGTLLAGVGIAVMNVVVPALVRKRFQPTQIGHMMGLFSLMLGSGAVLTAGLTVPIYQGLGATVDAAYLTLGAWAIPALIALVFWAPQLGHGQPLAAAGAVASGGGIRVLKNRTAWSITLFFGLQALNLYALLAWLPSIYVERGATVAEAALYLAVSQVGLVLGGYFAPVLAARVRDQRGYIAATVGLCLAGCLGLLYAPLPLAWLAVLVLGIGQGAGPALSALLFVLRSPDQQVTTQLSAMAQGFGFMIAVLGPLGMGLLHQYSGGWVLPLQALIGILLFELCVSLRAGKPGTLAD
ncbi:MFS transporter [Pseudomonas sp. CF161]|uniref:MFS transporter n=1 Tax=Pseudomonas sp. CF161 TaxID=911241 RepID=UPI0003551FCA|nr:MFS transporter [Pseudomonas sp. CF161]EPL14106.1 major facilitator transporter [Pseudomonas sp. CF161]